ncbi:hypothetical protein [Streptomyces sp. NPDC006446]|uniref:hypothetical protein n=1 Tax=Streptomyces sp. NPDC006446 TaxID=3154301 RepID=UPI0033ABC839
MPWRDRQIMGTLVIAVAATAVALAMAGLPDSAFWRISGLVSLLSIAVWAGRGQLFPLVRYDQTTLVVRNTTHTYEIPWEAVRSVDWHDRTGLSLMLTGDGTVAVQAFSRWPSFGRHRKVVAELERNRQQWGKGAGGGDPVVVPASGITELVLFLPILVLVISLLVKGVGSLLS